MDEKTINALAELATKLGVTAEYLWGVLIKQAPISGAIDLAVMFAWVAGIYLWTRYVRQMKLNADESNEIIIGLAWFSVALATILAVIIIGCNLSRTIAALVNPEYWALQQIMKLR